MNYIVDILILAVFALLVIKGVKNGLVRSVVGLLAVIVAVGVAVWLSEPMAQAVYNIFIKNGIESAVASQLPDVSSAQLTAQNVQEIIAALPESIVRAAESMGVDIAAVSRQAGEIDLSATNIAAEICNSIAMPIAVAVLKVLCFALIFFVCNIALQFVAKVVCKLFDLPVIRSVNRTLGGVFGAVKGVLVVVSLCLLLDAVASLMPANELANAVRESRIVSYIVSTDIFSRLITV